MQEIQKRVTLVVHFNVAPLSLRWHAQK